MKKIQKTIAISLATLTAFSASSTLAFANQKPEFIKASIENQDVEKNFTGAFATIKKISENRITAEVKDAQNTNQIIFKISSKTALVDNATGSAYSLADFKEGDNIYVYHSLVATKSSPPQTNAYVIIANVKEKEATPILVDVKNVTSEENGVRALSKDNSYVVRFNQETNVLPYMTKELLNYQSIKQDDRVLVWSNIVLESMPAQTIATKAVIIPLNNEEITEEPGQNEDATEENITVCEFIKIVVTSITGELPTPMDTHYATAYMNKAKELDIIDGNKYDNKKLWDKDISKGEAKKILSNLEKLDLDVDMDELNNALKNVNIKSIKINGKQLQETKTIVRNSKIMVPLRAVCDELGFNITWDEKTNSCEINNGEVKSTLQIGYDSYFKAAAKEGLVGLTAPHKYGVPPILVDNKTYIPAEFFNLLYSNPECITVNDGVLSINK